MHSCARARNQVGFLRIAARKGCQEHVADRKGLGPGYMTQRFIMMIILDSGLRKDQAVSPGRQISTFKYLGLSWDHGSECTESKL